MLRLFITTIILLTALNNQSLAVDRLLLSDDFESQTRGKTAEITYETGKDGLAASFNAPDQTIEYPAEAFAVTAGRIEFDVQLKQPLSTKRPIWCLFSDIGSAGAQTGAVAVRWAPDSDVLDYGIYEASVGWHWIYARNVGWKPGQWYKIGLSYGPNGMRLEVDGKVMDSNNYQGGLASSPKKLGFYDPYFSSAPMLIDNLRCYRTSAYDLKSSSNIICPIKDTFLDDTSITYEVADDCVATIDVQNAGGTVVTTLLNAKNCRAGDRNTMLWDGGKLPSGDYNIRLTAKSSSGNTEIKQPITIDENAKWREPKNVCKKYFPRGLFYMWENDFSMYDGRITDEAKVRAYYEKTIGGLAKQGFNLIFAVWTPTDHRKMLLDIAQEHGVKVVVYLHEIYGWIVGDGKQNIVQFAADTIKDIKNHPAVAGYYIIDEPSGEPAGLQRIQNARKALEIADPKHPSFYCFVGMGQYEKILKEVGGQVLFIDLYPLWADWKGDLSGYVTDLARAQKNAEQNNIPLWMATQIFGKPNAWKIPTPEEIRAQVWLSLAYGTKGFIHFVYQSTTGIQGEWLQGVLDIDLNTVDGRLNELQQINADIKKLEPVLLSLTPADFKLPEMPDAVVAKAYLGTKDTRYVIIANKDTKNGVELPWEISAKDVLTGKTISGKITLPPGGGKVLRLGKF